MSEGISYQVKYETPSGVKSIDTVRYIKDDLEGMTAVHWYPDARKHFAASQLLGLEEEVRHIPNERIIEINEI